MSKTPDNRLFELFGEPISIYTRAQALEDGTLVDVSRMAREAGFRVPVAVTCALWGDIKAIPADVSWQSLAGRLWDVLWMAYLATRRANGSQVTVTLFRVPRDGSSRSSQAAKLQMHIGPGDQGEPVITIMMPGED